MEFKARVSEEVALELMRTEWPESGLFVEIKGIEDTGRIKMELTKGNKTPTRTKVEYVECDFSREWEAVKYYNEVGELFVFDLNGSYTNVNDIAGAWYEVVCKNYTRLYARS